jgi:hypothetical protein
VVFLSFTCLLERGWRGQAGSGTIVFEITAVLAAFAAFSRARVESLSTSRANTDGFFFGPAEKSGDDDRPAGEHRAAGVEDAV